MSRKIWIAALGAVLMLAIAASSAAAVPRSSSFDANWRFALVNQNAATDPTGAYENAYQPDYDDSGWRSVTLPHDWSIELMPTTQDTTAGIGYFPGGLGWYRKTFTLPRSLRGTRISLEFDGVYMDSDVYFN